MDSKRTSKALRHSFTLLEVIIAMAIFAILSMMMLQFFAGAQKVWSGTENRNDLYGNARIGMDLMSNLLQSTYCTADGTPFALSVTTTDNHKIYFATRSPLHPRGTSDLFFAAFTRDAADNLVIDTLCNEDTQYTQVLPPETYLNALSNANSYFSTAKKEMKIIPNVTFLQFRMAVDDYSASDAAQKLKWTPATNAWPNATYPLLKCPSAAMITMKMLGEKDYRQWQEMKSQGSPLAADFLKNNEITFTRIVYIGSR